MTDITETIKHEGFWLGKKRSEETKKKISIAASKRIGILSSRWNGGIRKDKKGYILEYKSEHPYCSKQGLVLQHRLVMEKMLGRYLSPDEIVHHINGDVSDNRTENLELFEKISKHFKHHWERGDYANRGK